MITLLSTDKLIAYMAEAKNTTEPTYDVSYYDNKSAETDITESTKFGSLNSTTDVELAAAPAATYNRNVSHISLCNIDVIAHTIIVAKDVSGTDTILFKIYLQPNQSWSYPIPETQSLKVINAKTNVGRTVTTATDTLLITDVSTELLAEYTGLGLQVYTIPKATYAVGDSIRIRRLENMFRVDIEDDAEQTINLEKYSGIVGEVLELRYIRDNGGKEQWMATGGRNTSRIEPVDSMAECIIAACENANYKVYLYQLSNDLSYTTINYGFMVKIINKTTLEERMITNYAYYNFKGLHYITLIDGIITYSLYMVASGSLVTKLRISTNGLRLGGMAYSTNISGVSTQRPFAYTKSGEIRLLVYHNTTTSIVEYSHIAEALSVTRYLTISNTYGFYSGAWDGVDSTGAGTAYIWVSMRTGGCIKVDIDDLSVVATIAGLSTCIFLSETPTGNYLWYLRSTKIGRLDITDNTFAEFECGAISINFSTWYYDVANGIIYFAVAESTSYSEFDIATETFTYYDISADLNSCTIIGLSFIPSEQRLYISGQKSVDGYEKICLVYQK